MEFKYILDLLLSSLIYGILVLVTTRLARTNRKPNSGNDDDDDDDGGINLTNLPLPDLPPGVTLPVNGPEKKEEEVLA